MNGHDLPLKKRDPSLNKRLEATDREQRSEAIVLGNGPSLRGFDFDRLIRFDVFGMNAAYRYWHKDGWFPQYYSCLDHVVGESHMDEIVDLIVNSGRLGIKGFLLRHSLIKKIGRIGRSDRVFNFDLLRPGYENWMRGPVTTGSHTCAWASILGYQDIYLLGVDCNYVEVVDNAQHLGGDVLEIVSDSANPNYFFDSYQQKGDKFNLPNPRKDLHLESWRNVSANIRSTSRVLNTNLVSKVDAFPFVSFEEVEKGGRVPIYSPPGVVSDYVLVPSAKHPRKVSPPIPKPATVELRLENGEFPLKLLGSILAYDGEWDSTGETEKRSLLQARRLLPEVDGTVYLGFPWSALVEPSDPSRLSADLLKKVAGSTRPFLAGKKHVVTVCQHADILRYQALFEAVGVTDLFWPHAVKGQDRLPECRDLNIYPFPLCPSSPASFNKTGREFLYTFVEPGLPHFGASETFRRILASLADNQHSLVIPRCKWDFNAVLHSSDTDDGIDTENGSVGPAHPIEYVRILTKSMFSLCPACSGTHPHPLRLWESIGCGAIPVILSDRYLPPGNESLWDEAAVFCSERADEIEALPGLLEAIAGDEALLKRKRHAMRQLWSLYGPDYLIYDIYKLFLRFAQEDAGPINDGLALSYGRLLAMASLIHRHADVEKTAYDSFILGCSSRVVSDPSAFKEMVERNTEFRNAYEKSLHNCSDQYSDSMVRNLEIKGVAFG